MVQAQLHNIQIELFDFETCLQIEVVFNSGFDVEVLLVDLTFRLALFQFLYLNYGDLVQHLLNL